MTKAQSTVGTAGSAERSSRAKPPTFFAPGAWWRWPLCVILLVGGSLLVVGNPPVWEVCDQRFNPTALPQQANRLQRVCRSPKITDVPVAAGLLLALMLILPEFSEISIPGFLSLKTQVKDQQERLERLRVEVRNALSASARAQVNIGAFDLLSQHRGGTDEDKAQAAAARDAIEGVLAAARRSDAMPDGADLAVFRYQSEGRLLVPLRRDPGHDPTAYNYQDGRGPVGVAWRDGVLYAADVDHPQGELSDAQVAYLKQRGYRHVVAVPIWSSSDRDAKLGVLCAHLRGPAPPGAFQAELLTTAEKLAVVLRVLVGLKPR